MSVPFRSKLSYAWEAATRRKHIYSRVFEGKHGEAQTSSWMKAVLVQGEQDAFVLYSHQHGKVKAFHAKHDKERQGDVFSHDQALEQIKKFEAKQKANDQHLSQKQPFRGRIETKLAPL